MTTPNATTPIVTIDQLRQALESAALAQSKIYQLGELFTALKRISDKRSSAHDLSEIGQYLAEDWGDSLECSREELNDLMRATAPEAGKPEVAA